MTQCEILNCGKMANTTFSTIQKDKNATIEIYICNDCLKKIGIKKGGLIPLSVKTVASEYLLCT